MRQTRVYTELDLSPRASIDLDGQAAHYLLRVLRLATGDPVTLFNGDGLDYPGEITGTGSKCVSVMLSDGMDPGNESVLDITLVQAISRGERMDYCLQKATELGVNRVQLLFSERVEVRLKGTRLEKRLAHWRGVIQSSCEQSGRARVPALLEPLSLPEYLDMDHAGRILLLDPQASTSLSSIDTGQAPVNLVIGPEGGFNAKEIASACASGVEAVSLGPRVLRTETAGPAAIAVLQSMAGDFR
jgi:16S rRNA (uracil1498-N3)-methyltransferase